MKRSVEQAAGQTLILNRIPLIGSIFPLFSILLLSSNAIGVETDVVFLLDRSPGVENCLFDFQLAAVSELICGGDCSQQSCADVHLPHDGSIAVSVMTYGWIGGIQTLVNKQTLDSSSAAAICSTIRDFQRLQGGFGTPMFAALQESQTLLEARDPMPAERVVIILSDTAVLDENLLIDPRPAAEALRTMSDTPARISAFRFSDHPYEGSSRLEDPDCQVSYINEFLAELANIPGTPNHSPAQPSGAFRCAKVCPCESAAGCEDTGLSCPTTYTYDHPSWNPANCQQSQQAIDDFVELAKASICSIPESSSAVTITQQPEQDPVPVMSTDEVTLTAAGVTDAAWLEPYYQWRLDGRILIGANEPELLLRRFDLCETGPYDCVVFSPCDVQVTDPIMLDVTALDCNYNGLTDACEHELVYNWRGRVGGEGKETCGGESLTQVEFGPSFGRAMALAPNDHVVYAGSVSSNGVPIDMDPTEGVDAVTTLDTSGEDVFLTRLSPGTVLSPDYEWSQVFGSVDASTSEFGNSERAMAVAIDQSTGEILIVGRTDAAADPNGDVLDLGCLEVLQFESGPFEREVFFVKLDASGNCQWARSFTVSFSTRVLDTAIDGSGNILITGYFGETVDFDPGEGTTARTACAAHDMFVAKYDGDTGDLLWVHVSCAERQGEYTFGRAVATDSVGSVYVTGSFKDAHHSNGTDFNPTPVCGGTPGDRHSVVSNTGYDIFLMKLSGDGCYQWTKTMGGPRDDHAVDLVVDRDDGVTLTGTFQNTASLDPARPAPCTPETDEYCHASVVAPNSVESSFDVFVARFEKDATDLTYHWSRAFGGPGDDVGVALALDPNENLLIAGYFCAETTGLCHADFDPSANSSDFRWSKGGSDAFLVQLGGGGAYGSAYTMGGPATDEAHGVVADSQGDVWVAGLFTGVADFDPARYFEDMMASDDDAMNPLSRDIFLVRFKPGALDYVDCDRDGVADYCGFLSCQKGDVNQDSVINSLDIQAFIQLLGSEETCYIHICPADLDHDGDVDEDDLTCLVYTLLMGFHTCELPPLDIQIIDCNGNEVPDDEDIANETSADVNENGIPDECEPDCNTNGVPDDYDILTEASADCNGNGIPDECEYDCNENGVPDDCDVDPSDPDGDEWVSPDCNGNEYPDECDLKLGPPFGSFDCNENGIPDECDLAACDNDPACDDCNENGIPDGCDIAAEISEDVNENGIPDECEGESFMMGGEGGGEAATQSEQSGALQSPEEDAAWEVFYEWTYEQCWGGDCEESTAEQFRRMIDMKRELGLPLERSW